MIASNLSPLGYCFSNCLRALMSHSGGGGYKRSVVSTAEKGLMACRGNLQQEEVIARARAGELVDGLFGRAGRLKSSEWSGE